MVILGPNSYYVSCFEISDVWTSMVSSFRHCVVFLCLIFAFHFCFGFSLSIPHPLLLDRVLVMRNITYWAGGCGVFGCIFVFGDSPNRWIAT